MKSFDVGGRKIGQDERVFFIAELSANHGQSIDVARKTIVAAAKAGADAIKLQTYTPDTLTLRSSEAPFVVRTSNVWAGRTLHDLYAEAMTPWEWHAELKAVAEENGLVFFSTPFDATATAFLEQLDVELFKVASFEIADLPLVERIARTGKPVIMSTGMASLGDIEAAVDVCRGAGNDRLVLLRCVSSYPARPDAMNLRSFETLRSFGTILGLSDHTRDATVAIASVALGARVIEKHFILDRSVGGPDSFFSLEPEEFRSMVAVVRDAERALGAPRFGVSSDEIASAKFRRSLFVARDVEEGAILTCDDVRSVRPADGLPARELPLVLGRRASRSLKAATPLVWDAVGVRPHGPEVELRQATVEDAEFFLTLSSDPEARAMALPGDRGPVNSAEGFSNALAASDIRLYVAVHAGTQVGQVKLSKQAPNVWELTCIVDPAWRRRGLFASLLASAETAARELGAKVLAAAVPAENQVAIRSLKLAGFYGFTESTVDATRIVNCERRIVGYGSPKT